jgi:hypothetical protein
MEATTQWLLEGDPAIRWQVLRDLIGAPPETVVPVRRRVASEGWGKRLLASQDASGTWGGGLYTPKWTSTTYTLLLLRRLGLEPQNRSARLGAQILLDRARWMDGGVSYWKTVKLAELCVNGMVLSIASYFRLEDPRVEDVLGLLADRQLADGGWNCDPRSDGHHSSFHTTVSVLEGLAAWEDAHHDRSPIDVRDVMRRAWEFFATHRLYRSHRTGDVIDARWTRFSFPPRWYYDVLRGLDHLASRDAPRDDRYCDAIDLVRARRKADGRWALQNPHRGQRDHFAMEVAGRPSRWNTLRAARVLTWWERGT